jgi:hypothetical protein
VASIKVIPLSSAGATTATAWARSTGPQPRTKPRQFRPIAEVTGRYCRGDAFPSALPSHCLATSSRHAMRRRVVHASRFRIEYARSVAE